MTTTTTKGRERKAKRGRPAKDKAKQKHFAGMEPPRIKALDDLAEQYREVRDERQRLTTEEVELKEKLLALMKDKQLTVYPIPDTDREVVLEHGDETVKVRKREAKKVDE